MYCIEPLQIVNEDIRVEYISYLHYFTKHRTKMKKTPNLDFRAPQVAFDFNHCLDFMEYIIFYCWLSQLMGILLPIGPSQAKES